MCIFCFCRQLRLFMVFAVVIDAARTINLFKQHDAGKLMREGHAGHRQLEIAALFDRRVQSPGAADDKAHLADAAGLLAQKGFGKLLGGKHLSFDAHGNHKGLRRDFGQDALSLLCKAAFNLCSGRVLRHFAFG